MRDNNPKTVTVNQTSPKQTNNSTRSFELTPPKKNEIPDNSYFNIEDVLSLESRLESIDGYRVVNYPNGDVYKGQLNQEKKKAW